MKTLFPGTLVITSAEKVFLVFVALALWLWVYGGSFINSTTVALLVVALMLLFKILSWDDVLGYKSAWNTLLWFATLVSLADGLSRVGFTGYIAKALASSLKGVELTTALIVMIATFYWLHYLFASLTAHTTALYPIFRKTLIQLGIPPALAAYSLAYTLGLMGIISPYATGPAPVYYGSGYIKGSDYWKLGLIFGIIYFIAYLALGLPILMLILK
jgi:L-tartrate/succinate antiporter